MENLTLVVEVVYPDQILEEERSMTNIKAFRAILIEENEAGVKSVKDIFEISADKGKRNGEVDFGNVAKLIYIFDTMDIENTRIKEFRTTLPKRYMKMGFKNVVNANRIRESARRMAYMKTGVRFKRYTDAIDALYKD